jgi:penicillin G amidase
VIKQIQSIMVIIFLVAAITPLASIARPLKEVGKIEVLRDEWGIPHIFAETDAGAFYGLGYAQAEDRAFHMYYALRIIQGRTAEMFGDIPKKKQGTTTVTHDKKIRTMGYYHAAVQVARNLDPQTTQLLQAFSDGVNDYITAHPDQLLYLFKKYDVKPEPWTPADCIAVWWNTAKFFSGEGLHDTMTYHRLMDEKAGQQSPPSARGENRDARQNPRLQNARMNELMQRARDFTPPVDEEASVVKKEDVSEQWINEVHAFLNDKAKTVQSLDPNAQVHPKFSHAWVVGGAKTTTGSAVLVSDPQTPVRNPSLFYEYHFSGKSFNARGIGVPGSPVILIGFTDRIAWGITALGADQADQFMLKTDPNHPNQYFFDGKWRDMDVWEETIKVKDGETVKLVRQQTHFGPVITSIAHAVRPGEQVALKRIPQCENNRETIQGFVSMIQARNIDEFSTALEGWRFPSANIVFGDTEGNIGYWTLAAIPMRSPLSLDGGNATHDGSDSKYDWLGIMPYKYLPHVINPKRGYLLSGNHRPVGSFYPSALGISTGAGGDTNRSWRLRERLQEKERYSPEDVLDIHYDTVNIHKREIIRLAYHVRDQLKKKFSPSTMHALDYLENWYKKGAMSDMTTPGTELVNEIPVMFRLMTTELAFRYGGGNTGLSLFLKDTMKRLQDNPNANVEEMEIEFIDDSIQTAWQNTLRKYGDKTEEWNAKARQQNKNQRLAYFESLDGFHNLDRNNDIAMPDLRCIDGGTIQSQVEQSYTQWVPMQNPDMAKTMLPIGQSEHPESPYRLSTMELWSQGQLHPAPLSREKVDKIKIRQIILN